MRELYPSIQPYATHKIEVESPHVVYVEECGNPEGIPVLFIHGGPGAGCSEAHRRFFNPEKYRIVLFDQRGCGRSTPHAELELNHTQALMADMEQIREHLKIKQWVVFGGSWGSTLGLAYAQCFTQRALGLILRGIFLCRPSEIQWFYQEGASHLFPDYWEEYLQPIPERQQDNLLKAYYKRLTGNDEVARMAAAKAWSSWEASCSTLEPAPAVLDHFSDPFTALSLARIECHYFMNDSFLEENQLLRDAYRLEDVPGVIVQGRYDAVCPMESAWALHKAWPQADFQVIADAGHSAFEPGILNALIEATDAMAERLV